jgi:hypothetical protein
MKVLVVDLDCDLASPDIEPASVRWRGEPDVADVGLALRRLVWVALLLAMIACILPTASASAAIRTGTLTFDCQGNSSGFVGHGFTPGVAIQLRDSRTTWATRAPYYVDANGDVSVPPFDLGPMDAAPSTYGYWKGGPYRIDVFEGAFVGGSPVAVMTFSGTFPACSTGDPRLQYTNGCTMAPDRIPRLISLTDLCNMHDVLYARFPDGHHEFGSNEWGRLQADLRFLGAMLSRCNAAYSWYDPRRGVCLNTVSVYYHAVRALGAPFYYDSNTRF